MPPGKFIEKVQHNIDALRRQVFRVGPSLSEVKESIKRFWAHIFRARGYLALSPINVPSAKAELQGALSELVYQKGYMSPHEYEEIKTHLEWAIDFLDRDLVPRAITELENLFSFLIEQMSREMEERTQIPPEGFPSETEGWQAQVLQGDYLIVYRGQSDIHHQDVLREGIQPTKPDMPVYTAIQFREAVRFAWSHSTQEGGKPIIYRLSVPISLFTGQVIYRPGPTGFLMSRSIPRQYIADWVMVPENLDEVWKLEDHYEAEENARKSETLRLIEKIPKVTLYQLPVEMQGSVQIPPSSSLELKERFGSEFRNMILEGEREGREVGAMICQSPSGELHLSRVCWGMKGKVHVTDCHDHLRPYGSYHVHLHGSEVFSPQDLEQAIDREQLSCIGYMKGGVPTLKCITPRKYYDHTPETKTEIRKAINLAAEDITQLGRDPNSPEARKLSGEVQKKLYDIEQFLGASEIQL